MGLLSSWAPAVVSTVVQHDALLMPESACPPVLVSGALTSGYWVLVRHT